MGESWTAVIMKKTDQKYRGVPNSNLITELGSGVGETKRPPHMLYLG